MLRIQRFTIKLSNNMKRYHVNRSEVEVQSYEINNIQRFFNQVSMGWQKMQCKLLKFNIEFLKKNRLGSTKIPKEPLKIISIIDDVTVFTEQFRDG